MLNNLIHLVTNPYHFSSIIIFALGNLVVFAMSKAKLENKYKFVLHLLAPIQTRLQNAVNRIETTQDDIDTAILLVDEWVRGFVAETYYCLEAQNTVNFENAMRKRGLEVSMYISNIYIHRINMNTHTNSRRNTDAHYFIHIYSQH